MTKGIDGLTHDELILACKNIGFNLDCGACASLFYTGFGGYDHDPGCPAANPRICVRTISEVMRIARQTDEDAVAFVTDASMLLGLPPPGCPADHRTTRVDDDGTVYCSTCNATLTEGHG